MKLDTVDGTSKARTVYNCARRGKTYVNVAPRPMRIAPTIHFGWARSCRPKASRLTELGVLGGHADSTILPQAALKSTPALCPCHHGERPLALISKTQTGICMQKIDRCAAYVEEEAGEDRGEEE
jgi:hypothetical protein